MEISANELRIGNWYDHNGEYCQVSPNTILEVWESPRKWVQPIPLTPEILEKCGFISNPYQDRYELGNIHVEYCGIRNICFIEASPHIEYLHQLQNYVYINTNQELTFKP